jgi:hypothetical protein
MASDPTDDQPLTPAEQQALQDCRRDEPPPPQVEQRVVDALRDRGFLQRTAQAGRGARRGVLVAISAAAVFIVGVWLGASWPERTQGTAGPRYMLLLYEDDGFQSGGPQEAAARVREYTEWARTLARSGHLVAGDELGDGGQQLSPSQSVEPVAAAQLKDQPRGYFVIAAPDEAAALRLASTCPHLRHGGRIIVRRIAT